MAAGAGPWHQQELIDKVAVAIDRRAPVLVAMPFVIVVLATSGSGRAMVTLIVCALLVATTLGWDRLRGALLQYRPST